MRTRLVAAGGMGWVGAQEPDDRMRVFGLEVVALELVGEFGSHSNSAS